MSPHYVYTLMDSSDVPIYIGCTKRPTTRITQHVGRDWWPKVNSMFIERFESKEDGRNVERARLEMFEPVGNIEHTPAVHRKVEQPKNLADLAAEGRLISTAVAAGIVRRAVSTFHRHVIKGDITPVFRGDGPRGVYLFDMADVEALALKLNGVAS